MPMGQVERRVREFKLGGSTQARKGVPRSTGCLCLKQQLTFVLVSFGFGLLALSSWPFSHATRGLFGVCTCILVADK